MRLNVIELKEIFSKIEETLQNQSSLTKQLFDCRFGKFKNIDYRLMADDDIFWILVYVTFYSGMKAATVSQKLVIIKRYLYDFRKVKDYSQQEINQILNDPNMIHNKRKINACIENAKEFYNLISQKGSFQKYLESFEPLTNEENIERLKADLRRRFHYLGERTVNHFLTDLGLNVLKPDRVICRIFERLGLIENKNNIGKAIEVGKKIAVATNYPIRYIDICFVKYGQMGEDEYFGLTDGICLERNPKCSICGVKEYCRYYANHNG